MKLFSEESISWILIAFLLLLGLTYVFQNTDYRSWINIFSLALIVYVLSIFYRRKH